MKTSSLLLRAAPLLLVLGLAACDATYTENPGDYTSSSSEGFLWASSYSSSSMSQSSVSSQSAYQGPGCDIGGCSGQLCVKEGEDVMSTCEWKEEYACYRTARCEKQPSGECGWTMSPELALCLAQSQ